MSSGLQVFAIAYAEDIAKFLPSLVYSACSGYKNGVDKNTNPQQHDVCTLRRRKRIETFTDMAVLVGSAPVQEKVVVRLKF